MRHRAPVRWPNRIQRVLTKLFELSSLGVSAPGGLVEVTGKLTMGSRVVARGGDGLRDAQRVKISGEESEAAFSDGSTTVPGRAQGNRDDTGVGGEAMEKGH